ncbi:MULTISPECIES: CvpA family protein [Dyella]|uniref:CvpA family protein n=2 Tax=Dyella TaxID=231454 RepID=A0A4R0Z130_9GAMM|nr:MULTISPECIES: CvpA family protein [Dyella]TBR39088.1 CvpA family protein [Dyella terrae]TCI13324.1 CvpA family protein [Dyella soli]
MNWTDYIIVAVLGLSVLIGLWRGLISEVLALGIWIAAFWVAWTFGPDVSGYFEHRIELPSARILVGYGICFLAVLLAGALLRFVVSRLVEGTGLSGTDRLLGMVFGFARGVLLVTLAVFLLGFTAFARDPWWQQSVLLPQFKGVAAWLGDKVPDSVRRYLNPPAVLDHLPALPAAVPGATPAPAHSTQVNATAGAVTAATNH